MTVSRGVKTIIDNFDYAISLGSTPAMNGWTMIDTSSAGTPTYVGTSEDGGSVKITSSATDEVQTLTLCQNDVLNYDLAQLQFMWWIVKVPVMIATCDLVVGLGAAQNDTEDSVVTNAWFKIDGSVSTTALVVETDDATTDNDDVATGTTLGTTYKKLMLDFTNGLADVRFLVDQERVAAATTFDMSALTAGLNVQPYVQLNKASAATQPSVQIAQFGAQYNWFYGT